MGTRWGGVTEFFKHGIAVYIIKSVRKVQKKDPALVVRHRRYQLGGGMDDSFTSSGDTNAELERS